MVHAVLANRPGAFAGLVREHQRLVWMLVQRLVREPEVARELCQEAFARVARELAGYRFESSLRTWIGRVATSVALRHLERRRIETVEFDDSHEAAADTPGPAEQLAHSQAMQRLRDAIDALPPVPRLVVTLFHLEELSIDEVAALTGLKAGTVKSHLHRARERLRHHLTEMP